MSKVSEQSWLFLHYLEEQFKDLDARMAAGEGYGNRTPEQAKETTDKELAMVEKFGGVGAVLDAYGSFQEIVEQTLGLLTMLHIIELRNKAMAEAKSG